MRTAQKHWAKNTGRQSVSSNGFRNKVQEEVESVRDTLGKDTVMTGFYSCGEICPIGPGQKQAELHNQTMTITTFSEHLYQS